MIESVMFFALGVFASGLFALAILRALVRRTGRVTEKNLRASLATRRAEFQVERDELKVRHAVTVRQLEREGDAFRDTATAHRLEADLRDQENADLRADLNAREIEVDELTERLEIVQDSLLQAERKLAESGGALRTARHALESEAGRRADLRDRLAEMTSLAKQRRLEIIGLRADMARLRSRMGFAAVSDLSANADADSLRSDIAILRPAGVASAPTDPPSGAAIPAGGPASAILERPTNVINLPEPAHFRPRRRAAGTGAATGQPAEPPVETLADAPEAENIRKIASEIHRIAGEAAADLERGVWRAMAHPPAANAPQEQAGGGAAAADRGTGPPTADDNAGGRTKKKSKAPAKPDNVEALRRVQDAKAAEARFMQALEDIRALKRAAAGPAGE
jgi:hypothetical protein